MTDRVALPRKLIVFGLALPLAALIGYVLVGFLVSPDMLSLAFLGGVVFLLLIPIFLKWHHPLLVFSWNFPMILVFLPGSPPSWMLMALISFGVMVLSTVLNKEQKLIHVPVMTWAMGIWVLVVLFTMKMTGAGFGLSSLGGGTFGGKKFFYLLLGVVAYFALSTRRVPVERAHAYVQVFVVSSLATVLASLAYSLGPAFWKLYYLFPVDLALSQAMEDFSWNPLATRFNRLSGLAVGGGGAFAFMMARYGVAGMLDMTKPWRFLVFLGIVTLTTFGGFRSMIISMGILFALQFFLEGLHRTRVLIVLLVAGFLGLVALVPFASKLPLSVQRSLTVLPLDLHPAVRMDTASSTEWRLQMWQLLWPQVPKYFWIGKGHIASPTDHYLIGESVRRGLAQGYEASIIAGDYHSGPFSVILPYGIWGVLAFLFLIGAGFRVLWNNYRHGDPALRKANIFLFSSFIAKLVMFLAVFGQIHTDLAVFAGFVGLSIAINGGESRPRQEPGSAPEPQPTTDPAPFFPRRGLARR